MGECYNCGDSNNREGGCWCEQLAAEQKKNDELQKLVLKYEGEAWELARIAHAFGSRAGLVEDTLKRKRPSLIEDLCNLLKEAGLTPFVHALGCNMQNCDCAEKAGIKPKQ